MAGSAVSLNRYGELVAIKMHFGEMGGHACIRPTIVRRIVGQEMVLFRHQGAKR